MGKKTAIAILNWNGKKWLEQFLPSVCAQSTEDVEVYVIDNESNDDSITFVREHFPAVKLVLNDKNYGFAAGYNQGLQTICADYYLILNNDVELAPNFIPTMLEALKDEKVAVVQPKLLAFNQKTHFEYAGGAGGQLDYLGYPFCKGRLFDTIEEDSGQYDQTEEIFWATGACMLIRADLFHQFGGFDADFFAHQEEIDLCWRLKSAGYRILSCPKAVAYHVGGGSLNYGNPRKTYLNFRNNLMMLFKNYPFPSGLMIIYFRLWLDGLAAMLFLSKGQFRDILAILKAHFAFYLAVPTLIKKRVAFKDIDRTKAAKQLFSKSIIWHYYATAKRTFTALKTD